MIPSPTVAADDSGEAAVEEAHLLTQVAAGDRIAFRQLYARYQAPLFSLAIRMTGDPREAEEALQDAFVKMWRHAPRYDARLAQPFTWAVTIVRRTCIDRLRRRRRIPHMVEVTPDTPSSAREPGQSPRRDAQAHEDVERVKRALAELPERQRAALELVLFSELSHTEVAARMNEPVGTVKSWIRRGLLELRASLKDCAL